MGNRSRYVALTAGGVLTLAAARRLARLRRAMEQAALTVAVPLDDAAPGGEDGIDEAHAPGHRHLSRHDPDAEKVSGRATRRPWTRAGFKVWEPFAPR